MRLLTPAQIREYPEIYMSRPSLHFTGLFESTVLDMLLRSEENVETQERSMFNLWAMRPDKASPQVAAEAICLTRVIHGTIMEHGSSQSQYAQPAWE